MRTPDAKSYGLRHPSQCVSTGCERSSETDPGLKAGEPQTRVFRPTAAPPGTHNSRLNHKQRRRFQIAMTGRRLSQSRHPGKRLKKGKSRCTHRSSTIRIPCSIMANTSGNRGNNHCFKARLETFPIRSQTITGARLLFRARSGKSSSLVTRMICCSRA